MKDTGNFLKLHTDILNSKVVDMYGKYIYIYILRNTDSTGYCRRSYSSISEATGISVSKVKDSIKKLVADGIIKKISGKNESGCYDVNKYYAADKEELWQLPVRTDRKKYLDKCFNSFVEGISNCFTNAAASMRPFIMVSYSLLDDKLLSIKEKLMYICLSSFKNRKTGFCFPSLKTLATKLSICKTTAAKYINLLVSKGFLKKRSYYNGTTGARSSSRYEFLNKEKPDADRREDELNNQNSKQPSECRNKGLPPDLPPSCNNNNISFKEPWTDESIRAYYNYDDLITHGAETGINPDEIDYVLNIIRHNLNSKEQSFTYKGESLPMQQLKASYLKLDVFNILYVIGKYNKQTVKINNPEAYIKILLYTAPYQENLEIQNEVMHNMYSEN